jgi:hypothetical protein
VSEVLKLECLFIERIGFGDKSSWWHADEASQWLAEEVSWFTVQASVSRNRFSAYLKLCDVLPTTTITQKITSSGY